MTELRIMIVDDHAILRESLSAFISAEEDLQVTLQAASGPAALAQARSTPLDLVLLDLGLPTPKEGFETLTALKALSLKTLILTMHEDRPTAEKTLALGADGYITKSAASEELLHAIRTVAAGGEYINANLNPAPGINTSPPESIAMLSEREREVLQLVAFGHTSKEIAKKLGISRPTVDTYRIRFMEKLALKSRVEIVSFALRTGLLS